MANKEATVMVLDVGRTMWHSLDVDGKTHLDNACTAIAHILHSKITQGRKTDLVAIVLVGTDGTKNALNEKIKTQYKHITTYVDIGMASLDTFKYVTNGCEKGSGSGDIIDGIVVAITMLEKHCKHLKWVKSIFVFSDFSTEIDTDDDNKIISKAVDYG
ncbi:X-ray repair cross-complementing protein 5, partial [Physocladia obscura]